MPIPHADPAVPTLIGSALTAWMREGNHTNVSAAEAIGVPVGTLRKWREGQSVPREPEHLAALAGALEWPVARVVAAAAQDRPVVSAAKGQVRPRPEPQPKKGPTGMPRGRPKKDRGPSQNT